jgi:hypothetical protein
MERFLTLVRNRRRFEHLDRVFKGNYIHPQMMYDTRKDWGMDGTKECREVIEKKNQDLLLKMFLRMGRMRNEKPPHKGGFSRLLLMRVPVFHPTAVTWT